MDERREVLNDEGSFIQNVIWIATKTIQFTIVAKMLLDNNFVLFFFFEETIVTEALITFELEIIDITNSTLVIFSFTQTREAEENIFSCSQA